MSSRLPALRSSVEHLAFIVGRLEEHHHESSAYPSDWTIADTMSHLGSGAVISKRRLDDTLAGRESDPTFNQSVWDEWNNTPPSEQVSRALLVDAELLEALEAVTEEQRSSFHFSMGPFNLDFDGMVGLRLNEHALHTWDVEVALDPSATLPSEVAETIIDNLSMIVGFAGKANGETKEVTIRTSEPSRDLILVFAGDSVSLRGTTHTGSVDVEMPAEAFVRLVYGRLDASNAPSELDAVHLESLQKTFPGF